MIELCVVMGIVTVLMAMVVGLSRHVNETVKIRRAQADLGEWQQTFQRWHLQFGEYPRENVEPNGIATLLVDENKPSMNLSNILQNCRFRIATAEGETNIAFRAFLASGVKHLDPWGSPYIYDCDPGKQSYTLYSCGPDSKSVLGSARIPTSAAATPDPTLDDIYLER